MTSSNSSSYQSINVSVNGVVKNLIIPFNSLPSATRVPGTITIQPQDVPPLPAVESSSIVSKSGQTVAVSGGGSSKLTSLLSGVRFPTGGKTLVTIRPKTSGPGAAVETGKGVMTTVVKPMNPGQYRMPMVRPLPPGLRIAVPMTEFGGEKIGGRAREGLSVIRTAQTIRPIGSSIIRPPPSGTSKVQYVVQPSARHAVPSGVCGPRTILVKGVGLNEEVSKKTVMIRMPPSGSTDSSSAASRNLFQSKPGHVWVEVKDSKTNVVRYIQMRKKEPEKNTEAEVVERPDPPRTSSDSPTMTENLSSENIKVIEIVPDEDDDDDDEEEHLDGTRGRGNEEEKPSIPSNTSASPCLSQLDPLPSQDHESHHSRHHSGGSSVCESLKDVSEEDATTAVSALRMPPKDDPDDDPKGDPKDDPKTPTSDHSLNVVLRGEDHMVIENPKYCDDDDDDDDDDDEEEEECTTITADEISQADLESKPQSLTSSPEKGIQTVQTPAVAHEDEPEAIETVVKRKNVAKRTGGRPKVPKQYTARRTGGRPMTIKERYGADIIEVCLNLSCSNTTNSRPYTNWVAKHLCQISSGAGRRSETKNSVKIEPKVGSERRRNPNRFATEEDPTSDRNLPPEAADSKPDVLKCSDVGVDAIAPVSRNRRTSRTPKRLLLDLSEQFESSTVVETSSRKRTSRQKRDPIETVQSSEHKVEVTEDLAEEKSGDCNRNSDAQLTVSTSRKREVKKRTRKKLLSDDETFELDSNSVDESTSIAPKISEPDASGNISPVNKRAFAKSKRDSRESFFEPQMNDSVDQRSEKSSRRRPIKRKSEPIKVDLDESGEATVPVGADGDPGDAGTGRRKRARRGSAPIKPETPEDSSNRPVPGSGSSEAQRPKIIVAKASLLKPLNPPNSDTSSASPPKLILKTVNVSSPSAKSPAVIGSPIQGPLVISGSPKLISPKSGPGGQTKFYLLKTDGGSFLIPISKVSKPNSNMAAVPLIASPTHEASSPSKSPMTPALGGGEGPEDPGPANSPGQSKAPSAPAPVEEPDEAYEPAVAGMRQEDRISLLKEKLRQQQEKLSKMKRH